MNLAITLLAIAGVVLIGVWAVLTDYYDGRK